jgi:4-alpha-glucanotransferase
MVRGLLLQKLQWVRLKHCEAVLHLWVINDGQRAAAAKAAVGAPQALRGSAALVGD